MTRALLRAHRASAGPARVGQAGFPRSRGGLTESAAADHAALYRLMAWLSPAYPVGAFSYSSGIEWAVEAGDIVDAATLRQWLAVMIGEGGGFCDAVFFVHAHRAITGDDDAALRAVAELAGGVRAVEGALSGNDRAGPRFLDTTRAAWSCAGARSRLIAGLGGRRWRCRSPSGRLRRSRHRLRAGAACLPACAGGELDFRRRAAYSARPDRRPARARGAGRRCCRRCRARAEYAARRNRHLCVSCRYRRHAA